MGDRDVKYNPDGYDIAPGKATNAECVAEFLQECPDCTPEEAFTLLLKAEKHFRKLYPK